MKFHSTIQVNPPTKPNLLIYFAGWGTPVNLVDALILPPDYDLLICYDYRDLAFPIDLSPYQQIRVVAWSMGVWAANQVLAGRQCVSATAINGTGLPCHNELGIPEAIFSGTLTGLTEQSRRKFERRMCGDSANFERYQHFQPPRAFAEVRSELQAIYDQLQQRSSPEQESKGISWTQAIIGIKDKIFPPAHQQAYWQDRTAIRWVEGEHYLFPQFQHWSELW